MMNSALKIEPSISSILAKELLDTYGSPLYVYDADRLRTTIEQITRSIPYPGTQFRFASVTNGNVALLQIFRDANWGLHANTPGDIYLGLTAGFASDRIVYSGSNLDRAEMAQVLQWGINTLNLDSVAQVQLCGEVYQQLAATISAPQLGLRLNLPELTGESRIGVHPDEFPTAMSIAKSAGLKIEGLHFYRGTGTNATKAFTQVIDRLLSIAELLPDCHYLDFGGGFGYPYKGGVGFDWANFGAAVTARLERLNLGIDNPNSLAQVLGKRIELIIEPGRAAIASCATLLATVVSVKWQNDSPKETLRERQIVGVDTTVANFSVPAVHGGYREIVAVNPSDADLLYTTDICGNTTYSRDYLGRNCQLPQLAIGDIIAILDVGAYGYAMSSHFLHRPRPAEVLLEQNSHRLIRDRENYRVLLTNQIFDR
jgi:diaminopimelate decarboxylase